VTETAAPLTGDIATGRGWMIPSDGGQTLGPLDGARDRFLVDGAATTGSVALVEHLLAPRSLAAPLHLHTREDEYSYVLEGRVGAVLGGEHLVAEVGSVLVKPRGQWHTFWNAGDTPARLLEIIVPGGLEQLFRTLDVRGDWPDPEELIRLAAEYGAELDFPGTMSLVEDHDLTF
jgi:mannose-6-phosphate isomerase-like protein (cupin superfamily)